MKNMKKSDFFLGEFADPGKFCNPIKLSTLDSVVLGGYLESMIRIRIVERKIADGRRDGLVGGPVHLGVGQEAVAVGISKWLRSSDRVFGAHRSHSHLLALGSSVHGLFAEVLGRDTGLSRGMGGSMHLWDQPRGFYGSVPIVSATVPLAVGAGLAAKLQKTRDVAIAYLGDGAMEEGVVHESLNLARMLNVPVVFVVENNLFASHMHISMRQPKDSTARFAQANDIEFRVVDGNDVLAVEAAAAHLISKARNGGGPGFIEAITYRWYGHVDWREDIDVGVNRSQEEVANWRLRDPVLRLKSAMISAGLWSEAQNNELANQLQCEVDSAWLQAISDPYPEEIALLSRVYAS
jgi:pyruvate dehydrogenase E1 component alpha subunit